MAEGMKAELIRICKKQIKEAEEALAKFADDPSKELQAEVIRSSLKREREILARLESNNTLLDELLKGLPNK